MNGRNRARQLARAHMQQQHGRAHPHPRYGLCVCLLREDELVCAVGFALDPDEDRAAEEEVAAADTVLPVARLRTTFPVRVGNAQLCLAVMPERFPFTTRDRYAE